MSGVLGKTRAYLPHVDNDIVHCTNMPDTHTLVLMYADPSICIRVDTIPTPLPSTPVAQKQASQQ
jgi:hypothetical protein